MSDNLPDLLAQLIASFGGSKKDFAAAVGITAPALSRQLKPGRWTPPPGIELCLRFAKVGQCSASLVLRAAGKGRVADLIEDLYGEAANRRLNQPTSIPPHDRRHLNQLRSLTMVEQRAYRVLVQHAADAAAVRRQHRRGRAAPSVARGA